MRKLLGVVVLAILVSVVPANAQRIGYIPQTLEGMYYRIQGNQVQMLTADNLGLVNGLTNQLRRAGYRSVAEDWVFNGSAYGINTPNGFIPMYDRNMRPMGRREATITGAAIGAAIGYGVAGNTRGTAIGAAGGAIVGLFTHRGKKNNVVAVPSPGQGGYIGSDRIPVAVGTRPNANRQGGPVSSAPLSAGDWRISNRTSKRAELWDGDEFIARIEPWQSVQVDAPENGYSAVLLIPNRSGGLDQETAQIRSSDNFNGWDIVAPAVQ